MDGMTEENLDDLIQLELAHAIWFLQRGKDIEDVEELHEVWREENSDARKFSMELVKSLYRRGMMVSFYDRSLSHFAKED